MDREIVHRDETWTIHEVGTASGPGWFQDPKYGSETPHPSGPRRHHVDFVSPLGRLVKGAVSGPLSSVSDDELRTELLRALQV